MPVDVTVNFEGETVVLSFDVMPSFEQLYEAIRQDLVGPAAGPFSVVGTTLRGSSVAIVNQGALNRVCSDGSNFSVTIMPVSTVEVSEAKPPQAPRASATPSSKPRQQAPQQQSQSPTAAVSRIETTSALAAGNITCHGVLDGTDCPASDVGCVTSAGLLWLAEQRTGAIVLRSVAAGDIRGVIAPEQLQAIGEAVSACLCLTVCPGASGLEKPETVWAGYANSRVRVIDAGACTVVATLLEHESAVTCIVCTGHVVISGSADRSIRLWNSESYRVIRVLRGHETPLVRLAAEANFLFSASADRRVLMWNIAAGEAKVHVEDAHEGAVSAMATVFLGNSDRAMWSGGDDGRVRAWEIVAGPGAGTTLRLGKDFAEHSGPVAAIARCGSLVLSLGAHDSRLVVYDAATRRQVSSMRHTHRASAIIGAGAVEAHMMWLAGPADGKLSLWSTLDKARASVVRQNSTASSALYAGDADTMLLARELDHMTAVLSLTSLESEARIRVAADESIVRQLVVAEIENFCCRRHYITRQRAAGTYADLAFDSKIEMGMTGISTSSQLILVGSSLLSQAARFAQVAAEKNTKLITNFRQIQDELEEHVGTLKTHNRTLLDENRALRTEVEHLAEMCSKREEEADAANAARRNLEQTVAQLEDDLRGIERRKTELERENSSIAGTATADKRRLEVQLNKAVEDAKETQRRHAAQVTELEGRVEEAYREARTLRLDLAAAQQALEIATKRHETREKSAKEEEQRLLQLLEHERQVMCGHQSAAEEQHTVAQRMLSAKADSQAQEISLLRQRLREAQQTVADLSASVTESQTQVLQLTTKHEEESAMLKSAFDEATSSWKKDASSLQSLLREKTSALTMTEHKLRTAEVESTALQGTVTRLQRELDISTNDLKVLKDGRISSSELSEQKVLTLSQTVSTLRKEVASLETTLRQERNGRADAERLLAIAEENYESVQRQHHEATASCHDEASRKIQSLQAQVRSAEEKLVNATTEHRLAFESLLLQHQSSTALLARREKELDTAREELEEHLRRSSALALDLAQAKQQASESSVQRRRACELRDGELENLRQRFHDETKRLSELLGAKNEEIEHLQASQLAATDAAELSANRVQDLTFDNSRLRADLLRQQQEAERRKEADAARLAAQDSKLDMISQELVSVRAAHATVLAESERHRVEADGLREEAVAAGRDFAAKAELHKVAITASTDQIDKLQARIKQLTATHEAAVASHEHYIAEAEAERTTLAAELQTANEKLAKSVDAAAQLRASHDSTVTVLQERLAMRDHDLSKALENSAARVVEYEGKLSALQSDLTAARLETASVKKEKTAAIEAMTKDHRTIADALEAAQQRFSDAQHELSKKNEEITALQRMFGEQHRKESGSFEKRLELTRQSLNEQVASLTGELEAGRTRISSLVDQLHDANEKIFGLEEKERRQLRAAETMTQEWQLQVKGLHADLDAARAARDRLAADIQRLSEAAKLENETHLAAVSARNAAVEECRTELREKTTAYDLATLECQRAQRRVAELEEELRFATRRAQLQDETGAAQARELSKALDEALAEGARLRQALAEEQSSTKRLKADLSTSAEESASLSKMAAEREAAYQQQQAEMASELAKCRRQQRDAVSLANDAGSTVAKSLADLEGAVAERDVRCEELRQLCVTYKKEVERLHDVISLLEQKSDNRQLQAELEATRLAHKDVTVRYLEATREIQNLTTEYDRAFALLEATQDSLRRYKSLEQSPASSSPVPSLSAQRASSWSRERENYDQLVRELRGEAEGQRRQVAMLGRLQTVESIVFQQLYAMMLQAFDAKVSLVLGQLAATFTALRQGAAASRLLRSGSSDGVLDDVNAIIGDQRALLQQHESLRKAHETQAELLSDMRTELSLLFGRYRVECEQHEECKAELARTAQQVPSSLIPHLHDLVLGMKEASHLLAGLGNRPPVLPDADALVVLRDWLVSARSRGEALMKLSDPQPSAAGAPLDKAKR
jgi:chromosome segregation ATPase